jgi:plasmid replication initiation protein
VVYLPLDSLDTFVVLDTIRVLVVQIMAKLNQGEEVGRRVRINSHELLRFTNRGTSGRDYMALSESLDRLAGTRFRALP